MNTPPKKGKKPGKPSADPGKVTKLLAEARQVVDDLSGGSAPASPHRKKSPAPAGEKPRSRSTSATAKKPASRPKTQPAVKVTAKNKPATPPRKEKKPARPAAGAAAAPVPAVSAEPLLSPRECGISVVHSIPGRIRFKIKSLQYDADFARELEARLAAAKGIVEASASPATGSFLISYNSKETVALPLGQALQTWFPRLDLHLLAEMLD